MRNTLPNTPSIGVSFSFLADLLDAELASELLMSLCHLIFGFELLILSLMVYKSPSCRPDRAYCLLPRVLAVAC